MTNTVEALLQLADEYARRWYAAATYSEIAVTHERKFEQRQALADALSAALATSHQPAEQVSEPRYIVTVVDNEHPHGIPLEQWQRTRKPAQMRDAAAEQAQGAGCERFTVHSNGKHIFDDDFTHDAKLTIDGDFENDAQRLAYAHEICALLNAAPTLPTSAVSLTDEELERAIQKYAASEEWAVDEHDSAIEAAQPAVSLTEEEISSLYSETVNKLLDRYEGVCGGPDAVQADLPHALARAIEAALLRKQGGKA